MSTTVRIIVSAIAGMALGFTGCSFKNTTTQRPEGEVKRVAYADKILLHMHPEKVLNYLPDVQDEQIAYLFGMSVQEYRAAKTVYADDARSATTDIL